VPFANNNSTGKKRNLSHQMETKVYRWGTNLEIWRKAVQRTIGSYIRFKQKQNENNDRLKYSSKESMANLSWVIAQVQFYGKTEKENNGCKLHLCHAPSKARHQGISTMTSTFQRFLPPRQ
jgi:hypothetical protein